MNEFVSPCSFPAVLCSNNWQSPFSNAVNQPSTSSHETNEPISLNQVNSVPVVVHHLPDFDQDSWTSNPPPGTENTATESFLTTQPPDQTNNNNNNTFSTGSNGANSASDSPSPSNEAFHHVCMSNSSTTEFQGTNTVASEAMTTNDMAGSEIIPRQPTANGEDNQESSSEW